MIGIQPNATLKIALHSITKGENPCCVLNLYTRLSVCEKLGPRKHSQQ